MTKIFLIAGHGQGDPGATSSWGEEAAFTREFVTLLAERAREYFEVEVYPFDKNCYKQSKAGNVPDYRRYNATIEIHFNAKEKKDPNGDGKFTGVGGYYHPDNPFIPVANKIVENIAALGFKSWGNFYSTSLLNLNNAQKQGANYYLFETAFIDDGDDMTFYLQNKQRMADSMVKTLCEHYGISYPKQEKVGWIQDSNGKWWYRHEDGSYTMNGWEKIDGKWYYFDQDGWMLCNTWVKYKEKWYYLKSNGVMAENEWVYDKDHWYYLKQDGVMASNEVLTIQNKKYSFGANGHMERTTNNGDLV